MDHTSSGARNVLVTGAGSGLGAAMALRLASGGDHVHLAGRRPDALATTAARVVVAGGLVTVHPTDVTDPQQVRATIDRVVAESGRLDVVVNNAGLFRRGAASAVSLDDWEQTLRTNLTGALVVSQAAVAVMRTQSPLEGVRGQVLFVNSGAGLAGYAPGAAYSASKFGLMGLADSLRLEVGAEGIKVTDVVVAAAVESELSGRADVRRLPADTVARAVAAALAMPGAAVLSRLDLTQLPPTQTSGVVPTAPHRRLNSARTGGDPADVLTQE